MNSWIYLLLAVSSFAPETWFHVIGGNASEAGIKADIAAIADAGISGIQFFHGAAPSGPEGQWPGVTNPIPCLSERWLSLVKCAETECHRRGLSFKLQNCPGWSMSGGPWITPDKAMRRLVTFQPAQRPTFTAEDDYHEIGSVTFPLEDSDDLSITLPNPMQINRPWTYDPDAKISVMANGKCIYEREVPQGAWQDDVGMTWRIPHGRNYGTNLVAFVESAHAPRQRLKMTIEEHVRLDDWEPKAASCLREFTMETNPAPVRNRANLTLVFGHVNMKLRNHPAPPEATGWECDKMASPGFELNFKNYLERLQKAGVKIDGTLVDSWECHVQTWTWKMEEEFQSRAGYALRPWLPALFGYVLKSPQATEKFLLDWRNVCSRLVEENYYGTIARLAAENGMRSQYETAFGDVVPGDLLRFWKFADEPMCEFWHPHDDTKGFVGNHNFKPVLPCVSAAHLYGKRRVSAESLTSFDLTFNENFREWKNTIDRHFCRGVTHVVFHTYTHNPIVNGKPPSTSFGCSWIGSPFLRLQPWWPYLREFTEYLAFCGRELERGVPAVDILMYLGDAVTHKPRETKLLFQNRYKYDYLNPDVLHHQLSVSNGLLTVANYPDRASQSLPMTYRVLWIPPNTYVSPESAKKIAALEHAGARVVRGSFTPDWPSPLTKIGRENDLELEWYQRREGDEDIFFLLEASGRSSFVRGQPGNWTEVNPVTGIKRPYSGNLTERPQTVREIAIELQPCANYPEWATNRVYVGELPPIKNDNAASVMLDLGKVCDWASVEIDGRRLGRLWCKPYELDVTALLAKTTRPIPIRVEVTSTIHNLLLREAKLPPAQRTTWTFFETKQPKYQPTGLYGPVILRALRF